MHHCGEARKGPRGFVQGVKHSVTVIMVRLSAGYRRWGTRLNNKIFGVCIDGPSVWCNSERKQLYRSRGHITLSQLHLCNRETFLFHFDHQRYEERFQVQETISGYHTWAWASNFDIDNHWPHWSHAIHSCLWLGVGWVHKRTSGGWRQCDCSTSPSASLCTDLLLSSRPLIISKSLPRFPPWRSAIFLL